MWARVLEMSIACWVILSTFIFDYPKGSPFFWMHDGVAGTLIFLFAALSFYQPLNKMHLFNFLLSFWLMAIGFLIDPVVYHKMVQNYIVIGLLLVMISIIPSKAEEPPKPWRDFYKE